MTVPIQDITLRDYFAAQAMQGMFSEHFSSRKEEIAKAAYLTVCLIGGQSIKRSQTSRC